MIASNVTRKGFRRALSDVVGIDIATTGVKAVRVKRGKDGLSLVGAAILPQVSLGDENGEGDGPTRVSVPKALRSRFAALAVTGESSVIRLLNLPGFSNQSPNAEATVREQVGLEQGYRLGYRVAGQARGKAEATLVAVGMSDADAVALQAVMGGGQPAPISVEVSALSSLSAFLRGPGTEITDGAVGLVETGAKVTSLAIFANRAPILLRKFDFGSDAILQKVKHQFGVDHETSVSILTDPSFDISQAVRDATGSFHRQLSMSKEFVERKVGVPVKHWYLAGGMSLMRCWDQQLREILGANLSLWNPVDDLHVAPDAWPVGLRGQEVRFASAIGAAVGALEESE